MADVRDWATQCDLEKERDRDGQRMSWGQPLGDYGEELQELCEVDTELGIVGDWCEPEPEELEIVGNTLFPAWELRALHDRVEARVPMVSLEQVVSRRTSRPVARIHLSRRLERVYDRTRTFMAAFAMYRRKLALYGQRPVFCPCVSCGVDTSFLCGECELHLCLLCRMQFQRCYVCQIPMRPLGPIVSPFSPSVPLELLDEELGC